MLAEIHEYISDQSADKYVNGIFETIKKLEKHPESCGPCRHKKLMEKGYRSCKYRNHLIIYEFIASKIVNILAIIHSKRNPSNLPEI